MVGTYLDLEGRIHGFHQHVCSGLFETVDTPICQQIAGHSETVCASRSASAKVMVQAQDMAKAKLADMSVLCLKITNLLGFTVFLSQSSHRTRKTSHRFPDEAFV